MSEFGKNPIITACDVGSVVGVLMDVGSMYQRRPINFRIFSLDTTGDPEGSKCRIDASDVVYAEVAALMIALNCRSFVFLGRLTLRKGRLSLP